MKKIPYGKQTILDEDIEEVIKVLKSDFLTQGPKIREFEQMIANYHNAKYAVAFSNGTAALHAAYHSLGIHKGDEIITSPISFVASANGAIYCGGKPKFVDIDIETNCIDIDKIENSISDKTKVITPVAFAGYPVDLKKVRTIADKHNCKVLYDAAHAIGSKRDGSFGMEYLDAAILSFHPVKHIAAGEGGMVMTNDKEVYDKLSLFRNHGITKDASLLSKSDGPWFYEMQSLGFNYRVTDIQAALAISQFTRIQENLKERNEIAKFYFDNLDESKVVEVPPSVGFEILNQSNNETIANIHSYHLYTIAVKEKKYRKPLYEFLHDNGILAQIHYIPIHLQPFYKANYGYKDGDFPVAEDFYEREISIPMYHNMDQNDMKYVVDTIKRFERHLNEA